MVESFACSFLATELNARMGIGSVVEHLRSMGLPEGRADAVQIALAEAVNNVVKHAYADLPPGDVRIRCNLDTEHLRIVIRDAGQAFPDETLPIGNPPDLTVSTEDMPEGGFGWFLIRELTCDIQYQRSQDGNQLSLCFKV